MEKRDDTTFFYYQLRTRTCRPARHRPQPPDEVELRKRRRHLRFDMATIVTAMAPPGTVRDQHQGQHGLLRRCFMASIRCTHGWCCRTGRRFWRFRFQDFFSNSSHWRFIISDCYPGLPCCCMVLSREQSRGSELARTNIGNAAPPVERVLGKPARFYLTFQTIHTFTSAPGVTGPYPGVGAFRASL